MSSEFDEMGRHQSEDVMGTDRNAYASKYLRIIDGNEVRMNHRDNTNLALPKIEFANAVLDGEISVRFDGFSAVFERLAAILDCLKHGS